MGKPPHRPRSPAGPAGRPNRGQTIVFNSRADRVIVATMAELFDTFDPWGPISIGLYEVGNADFVEDTVSATGLIGQWRPLSTQEGYSNGTRIRARKPEIATAYYAMPVEHRGVFIQRLLKAMFARPEGEAIRTTLAERLSAIGWQLTEDGLIVTQDALVTEAFFPPNSSFDAYVSLRYVIGAATTRLVIVDTYIGASLLPTLRAVGRPELEVQLLTVAKNLRADFTIELAKFRQQMAALRVEVRTSADFHDRFIVLDDSRFFHVGASLKDAGSRAFMISEIQDARNVEELRRTIAASWSAAAPFGG